MKKVSIFVFAFSCATNYDVQSAPAGLDSGFSEYNNLAAVRLNDAFISKYFKNIETITVLFIP